MKKLLLLTLLFIATAGYSQITSRDVSWSGIITDNIGNPIADTPVTLKFTYTNNGATVMYSESHQRTTDSKGFVSAEIGAGTVIQPGSSLRFIMSNLKLKVEVDTGSGFVTLSDQFLKAVPFSQAALYAGSLHDNFSTIGFSDGENIDADAFSKFRFFVSGVNEGEINSDGLKLTNLEGTGTKDVVVNPSGQLQRKPTQTKYYSINAGMINAQNFQYSNLDGLYNASASSISNAKFVIPINLPDGARMTNYKVVFLDNSSSGFTADIVGSQDSYSQFPQAVLLFNSNATSSSPNVQIRNVVLNHVVDNQQYAYYIDLRSNSWPAGINMLSIKKIVITYEE